MKLNVRAVLAAVAVLAAAALVLPNVATAQKVANPGVFALQSTGGQLVVGGLSLDLTPRPLPQCSDGIDNDSDVFVDSADPQCMAGPNGEPASTDDSELVFGFQPKINVSITGTVDGAGNVTIPPSGVVFPPAFVPINFNGLWIVRADVLATENATGTIDPLTGAAVLNVRARIQLSGNIGNQLPPTCSIGTTTDPIRLNLITGRKEAVPGGNGAITGSPYNPTTGNALLVDNAFGVPGATGCDIFSFPFTFPINDVVNSQVGIPSAVGRNVAVVAGRTAPVLNRAINPVITSSVPLSGSNSAPFAVTFAAANSTVSKAPASYSWEFSDGTTATGEYVDKTFNAGNQFARLTVTDGDGDRATTTTNFVVLPGTGSSTTTTTSSTTTSSTTSTTTTSTTTTSTTAPTTTSTTTTTAPTTTSTTTTSTTAPTTTSTTTTSTTAPTTTSTTIPQPTDDSIDVRLSGAVNYANGGTGSGGVEVRRDSFGISSVSGLIDRPGAESGTARLAVGVQRAWILPLWVGQVTVADPSVGLNLSTPVFGQISRGDTLTSARGSSSWFVLGTFPNLLRPYSLSWSVVDAG